MTTEFETEQETFWAGQFGDGYAARNRSAQLSAANLNFFARILARTYNVRSVIEYGANVGMNLRALDQLIPEADLTGIEINEGAATELAAWGRAKVKRVSILGYTPERQYDLAFTKGVLIHIAPDKLPIVYDLLAESAAAYVAIAEYYSPTPASLPYRGHQERLYKRDFAGEFLSRHPEFRLVDYGFAWRSDPVFPQDDITWFLLKRERSK
jgi:pseudaminic acid biosynthesis-associated methylase